MAAIITLTDTQKAEVVKLLKNLNLGFQFAGFGEAFVAMLDGAPLTLEEKAKAELKHLINNLNLGFFHIKAGDVLVDLMDATTAQATAKSITDEVKEGLHDLFNRLNLGLTHHDFGGLVKTAVESLATPSVPVITAGTAPAHAKVGGSVDLTTLFTIAPVGTAMTFKADADTFGKIDTTDGKTLKFIKEGDVVITASAAGATAATLTIHIEAAAKLTAVGKVEFSHDGNTWADTIADGILKVDTDTSFFVRVDPASVLAADDGSYEYDFKLTGTADGDKGDTAGIGGMKIINDAKVKNKAQVTGKTPADQEGKIFTVDAKVKDTYGTSKDATKLSKAWAAK
jgi:hypothetical protein